MNRRTTHPKEAGNLRKGRLVLAVMMLRVMMGLGALMLGGGCEPATNVLSVRSLCRSRDVPSMVVTTIVVVIILVVKALVLI